MALYDTIGAGYRRNRQPDPAWQERIVAALGDARRIVNVGAGAGSYEPPDRAVVAVEPALTMLRQRPPGSAPAVRGVAGALPFAKDSFDVAMAVLTVHHWPDPATGLAEMQRVAPRQVIVSWLPEIFVEQFWFVRDYLPGFSEHAQREVATPFILSRLRAATVLPLPVPRNCTDGFFGAYWRRPEAYLDAAVRASISGLATMSQQTLQPALDQLRSDLASGEWQRRYAHLLNLEELDLGYRIIVAGR